MKTKRLLSVLLTLILLIGPFSAATRAHADSRGVIQGVSISADGIMTWSPYAGATRYWYSMGGVAWETDKTTADLIDMCSIEDVKSGTYEVKLYAKDADNNQISSTWTGTYTYVAGPKLAKPTNVKWNKNTVSWDAVPNATHYMFSVTGVGILYEYSGAEPCSINVNWLLKPGTNTYQFKISARARGYEGSDLYTETVTLTKTLDYISDVSIHLAEPVIGEKPSYDPWVPSDSHCYSSDYTTAIYQNDVAWYDETDKKYLTPGKSVFQRGHVYKVIVWLTAEEYYEFSKTIHGVLNDSYTMQAKYVPEYDQAKFEYTFAAYNGTVELDPSDVQYNGTTPYVVYHNAPHKPGVIVKDKYGKTVDPSKYTVNYRDNVKPGTAFADVKMKSDGSVASVWFKIYLPPTASTKVQNVKNGIKISWEKVTDAKGYVIYRRAWNLISSGWTTFERWNNTTNTTWTDTKVYAGTRYQYGVKAYYSDPMDNYNLGIVGPLKTTVRITSRTLNSVTGGNKKLTVKWTGSSLFTGYQVQVATDANFTKDVKTVTISKAKTYQTAVSGLKANTTYYVRVRSYHIFEGTTYYGGWSNVLTGKTK